MVQGWRARLVAVPCLTVLTLLLVSVATAFGASGPADVVLRNGKIYTADPSRSVRQSIAFTGNTIVAVGTDADVAPLIGPRTVVIDLVGKLVLPGLTDNHIHPIIGAVNGSKCSLARIKPTVEAIRPVIQECIQKQPGGSNDWIEAVQLDNYGFSATAADLDAIEAERPLALEGNDGHTAWINSRGLAIVGATAATPDPPGGKMTRDASGAPTGAFSDTATLLVEQKIPAPSLEDQAALTAAALREMSAYGITALMDAYVRPAEAAVWRKIYEDGHLLMRVRTAIYVRDPDDDSDAAVAALVAASKAGDRDPNFLRAGIVKVFADGVMEAPTQTAALLKPYLDAEGRPTDKRGELYFDPKQFARLVTKLDAAGLAVHIHAIGDRAVRASLDAVEAARKANGKAGPRHQIAHLQLVDPADFPRFAELGVIADMQLEWAKREAATEPPIESYLGADRYRYLYPAGSLHAAGAVIAGGSDWDVSSYNPFRAMETAVTRGGENSSRPPLNLEERIPLTTAIDAYTINAAIALGQEGMIGSLEVGKRADLVILDRDILTVDPVAIGDTVVLATWLDGRLVHEASPTPAPGAINVVDSSGIRDDCPCSRHYGRFPLATPVPGASMTSP
jgi:predicted amidohydrolase YtcJ